MKKSRNKLLMLILVGLLVFAGLTQAVMAAPINTTVVAWGLNTAGVCDVPAGLTDATAIAAGWNYDVALKADGTITGWGFNGAGQYTVPEGLNDVKAIDACGWHTIALKADGTVAAWGWNYWGESVVPAGLTDVTAIAAGYYHSVALKADGTVEAWGYNVEGACDVPAGLTDVTAIAADGLHTVALKADGTVVAWGWNGYGGCNVPADLTDVTAIAAGHYHTVALKADGTVVAWGWNPYGQCNVPAGLTDVKAIAAGYAHTVALKEDGTVVAWGYNDHGQCNVPAGLTDVTAIAAGNYHTVALVNNSSAADYNVSFEASGGTPIPDSQIVTEGGVVTEPAAPTKAGLTFAGWYSDAELTTIFDFATPITADTTLYAKWTAAVSFNANGGTPIPDSQIVAEGALATAPAAPTKAGLTFGGWYSDAELTNAFDFTTPITTDTVLYAKWTAAISFEANGGTPAPDNQIVAEGGMATEPTAPTKAGLTFGGWYTNAELTNAFDFATPITADTNLYAKWTAAVSFNAGGGTPIPDGQIVAEGTAAIEPATAPTKAGFVFAGWYQDSEASAFDFTTRINSDMTLNARWLAPSDLIAQLRAYVVDNIANGNIMKLGNSLIAKLDNIADKLDRGDTEAALNQLDAFINEVAAQKGKNIETATADQLIQKAQLIIVTISQV